MLDFRITDIVRDLSNEDYHSVGKDIVSSSYLKKVLDHSVIKANVQQPTTEPMRFGSAFHTMMEFGEEEFVKLHPIVPQDSDNKRTKKYKDFIAENPDAITLSDYNAIHSMYNNVINNEFLKYHYENYDAFHEWSYYASDNDGVRYRVRPDLQFRSDKGDNPGNPKAIISIFDHKTCQDVTEFVWTVKKYSYDLSAIMYCDIIGIDPANWFWVAVEKTFPFTVASLRNVRPDGGKRKRSILFSYQKTEVTK